MRPQKNADTPDDCGVEREGKGKHQSIVPSGKYAILSAVKGICTDNPGIANLLTNKLVYVDKTDALLKIITDPSATQFFLSRPRRFGK